jgi:protein TonB
MMRVNGSTKVERRTRKSVAILIGLIVGLIIVFVGFRWSSKAEKFPAMVDNATLPTIEEQVTPPVQKVVTPTPSPPRHQEAQTETVAVVEDNTEVMSQTYTTPENTPQETPIQMEVQPVVTTSNNVETKKLTEQHIFEFVEEMPEYPGGNGELTSFLNRNIRYPIVALENGIQGRVTVSFTVNQDGSIVDVEVLRSIDPSLDKEAKRLVGSMPKWMPGRQAGKPVRVKFAVPVHFRLQQ